MSSQEFIDSIISKARETRQVCLTKPEDLQGYPWWRIAIARIWPVYESESMYLMRIWGLSLDDLGAGTGKTWQEPRYDSLSGRASKIGIEHFITDRMIKVFHDNGDQWPDLEEREADA